MDCDPATDQRKLSRSQQKLSTVRLFLTPPAGDVIDTASRRLALCKTIKKLERTGKSSVIDSFARVGLPKGAHRACDALHDPLFGFFLSIKELGLKETLQKWFPHMASDILTARSLPLPGTFLLKNDSWIVRMYVKGLLNVRTGVVVPAVGVAITEVSTRRRLNRTAEEESEVDRNLVLQQVHLEDALVSGTTATILFFVPGISAAAVVALGASAVWSAGATSFYLVRRHRTQINSAIERSSRGAQRLVGEARRRLAASEPEGCQQPNRIARVSTDSVDADTSPSPPAMSSASSVAWVAAALIAASALSQTGYGDERQ